MKKTIMIEILLLFSMAVLIACTAKLFLYISELKQEMLKYGINTEAIGYTIYANRIDVSISYAIPALIAAIANLAAIVGIAIKDFPCFKPIVDKLNSRKEQHAVAKAEKAEHAKQERIEKLQAELDELKKDE